MFGLTEIERVELGDGEAQHVFGLPTVAGRAVRLAAPDAPDRATVLVVADVDPGRPTVGWQLGPRALDIYTTDLDRGVAAARAAGWPTSPEAVIAGGPMRMRQQMVTGPDGLAVVLVDSTHRRSSVCDLSDAPLHSEPHSMVWSVVDHAASWSGGPAAGWTAGATISFSEPTVSDELGLPESPTPITMTMLSDAGVAPIRVELMTFDDHPPIPRDRRRPGGAIGRRSALAGDRRRVGRRGGRGMGCRRDVRRGDARCRRTPGRRRGQPGWRPSRCCGDGA